MGNGKNHREGKTNKEGSEMSDYAKVNWNEISRLGLLERINREIMHPLGLAVYRDPATGNSGGALVSPDGKWEYPSDAKQIIGDR